MNVLITDTPIEVNIKCTVKHLSIFLEALDLFTRLGIGQMEQLLDHTGIDEYIDNKYRNAAGELDYENVQNEQDEVKKLLYECKRIIFNCSPNGSLGICHNKVSDLNRIAFDMIQVLRYERYKLQPQPKQHYTVDAYPAERTSTTTGLIKVGITCPTNTTDTTKAASCSPS